MSSHLKTRVRREREWVVFNGGWAVVNFKQWLSFCAIVAATVTGADAAVAKTADWCKQIADGAFCAEIATTPPDFCGTKEVSVALADGVSSPWRAQTAASAINEASRCPNVKSWVRTDGQGNTQKSISDLQGLTATGVNAIVIFADGGPTLLPAIRDAFKQGVSIVPYRAEVGGKEGVDYTAFVGTDFRKQGAEWGAWMGKALSGKGSVGYLGGTPGNSEGVEKSEGIKEGLKDYPDVKWIGQDPFEVTNWDPSMVAQVVTGLIARYPKIDGLFSDLSFAVVSSNAFPRANRPLPFLAGQDSNAFSCEWLKEKRQNGKPSFQFMSLSSEHWNVRLAIEYAIASAAGGKVDQPLTVRDAKGIEHVVAKAGDKRVTNFKVDDSTTGDVFCDPDLPDSASSANSLTKEQTLRALKGGF